MKNKVLIGLLAFSVIALALGGGTYVWAQGYADRIGPNVFIGEVDVSGVDPEIARQRIQKRVDELITDGVSVQFRGETKTLPLATIVSGDLLEDVEFDLDIAIESALSRHHRENPVQEAIALAIGLAGEHRLTIPVSMYEEEIKTQVRELFPVFETEMKNASYEFTRVQGIWTAEIQSEQPGYEFNFGPFFEDLTDHLTNLKQGALPIVMQPMDPELTSLDAEERLPDALALLSREPVQLEYTDERDYTRSWKLTDTELAPMITPSLGDHSLSIDERALDLFIESIAEEVERPAQDARLVVENGWVKEFVEHKPGIEIDREAARSALLAWIRDDVREEETEEEDAGVITLAAVETEAEIKTGDVNDLGISEILGVGISSYRGSPSNRIRNIRNGIRLLNGRLIAPGETFSLIRALEPFTLENGYLPELVIKGDEIKPEIGGGLCQIGSTTFRATMNAGLDVVQRRNHSLVVSYYNDLTNGLPGTDATIYDPAPDYTFLNDTDHHVLFQAEMLEDIQQLRFTFWGTSDGRKGSYNPPTVTRWIGVGDDKEIETTDLAPGERSCQEAHIGADAHFTYTIVRPDGTVDEEVYSSHYRPLPKICLVGVQEESTGEEEPAGGFAEFPPGFVAE